jgi:hypothetical protein
MLVRLAVDTAMRGPDLVSAFSNAVFQILIHVSGPVEGDGTLFMSQRG